MIIVHERFINRILFLFVGTQENEEMKYFL